MSCWLEQHIKGGMKHVTGKRQQMEKIKALTLAKECYTMKLELLTNATVVEDAMRFVSSHTVASATTERDNANDSVTADRDRKRINRNDIQRSEESHNRQLAAGTATNNTIF